MGGERGGLSRPQYKNHHRILSRSSSQTCGCEIDDEPVGALSLGFLYSYSCVTEMFHTPQTCTVTGVLTVGDSCRACRTDGIFYLDMTGQDARKFLEELHIAKYLRSSRELHALSDVEKLGFELDNILPLGTTG